MIVAEIGLTMEEVVMLKFAEVAPARTCTLVGTDIPAVLLFKLTVTAFNEAALRVTVPVEGPPLSPITLEGLSVRLLKNVGGSGGKIVRVGCAPAAASLL